MGTGASAGNEASKEDIVNVLLPQYMSEKTKWDEIYHILVERSKMENDPSRLSLDPTNMPTTLSEVLPCTQEIVEVLNIARVNPKGFIPILEQHLATFIDDTHYPDKYGRDNLRIRTREGKEAVEKCIEYLRRAEPVRPVVASRMLEQAAVDHAKDLRANNNLMHSGSDGSSLQQRVDRQGEWRGEIGENIDCGNRSIVNAVMMMLIDDGVSSRVHRANCLNPHFLEVGGAIGPHPEYNYCVVLDFATRVLSWSEVQTTDIVITIDTANPDDGVLGDFQRVVRSIPTENVVNTIEEALRAKESIVTIDFKAKECAAVVSLKKGKTIRKLNVKWGT